MDIDAVIIEVEFQLESDYQPFGHFVCLRFVDQLPNRNKLNSIIKDLSWSIDFIFEGSIFFPDLDSKPTFIGISKGLESSYLDKLFFQQ